MADSLYAVRGFVLDWSRAFAFYKGVLGLVPGFRSDDMERAEFEAGGARLAVERIDGSDTEAGTVLTLRRTQLDSTPQTGNIDSPERGMKGT
ncbi:MAG: hypothetical protein QF515_08000 [Pseudomonadales bacterium]|nr:hypothetical protein [Pseudomonadales bacterium]